MSVQKHNISKTSNQRSSDDAEEALWWQLRANDTHRGQPPQIQSNVNGLVNQLKIYSSVPDTRQSRVQKCMWREPNSVQKKQSENSTYTHRSLHTGDAKFFGSVQRMQQLQSWNLISVKLGGHVAENWENIKNDSWGKNPCLTNKKIHCRPNKTKNCEKYRNSKKNLRRPNQTQ